MGWPTVISLIIKKMLMMLSTNWGVDWVIVSTSKFWRNKIYCITFLKMSKLFLYLQSWRKLFYQISWNCIEICMKQKILGCIFQDWSFTDFSVTFASDTNLDGAFTIGMSSHSSSSSNHGLASNSIKDVIRSSIAIRLTEYSLFLILTQNTSQIKVWSAKCGILW